MMNGKSEMAGRIDTRNRPAQPKESRARTNTFDLSEYVLARSLAIQPTYRTSP
jgi:hypothetical protein